MTRPAVHRKESCHCSSKAAVRSGTATSTSGTSIESTHHHAYLKPNCILRPSSAVVIIPAVGFEMFPSGLPKFVWFSRLDVYQRNSRREVPSGNRLVTEKSTRCVPGPRSVFRPAVPCVPVAGTTYAVLSYHTIAVGFSTL